jgi:hypothetical protein
MRMATFQVTARRAALSRIHVSIPPSIDRLEAALVASVVPRRESRSSAGATIRRMKTTSQAVTEGAA